MRKDVYQPSELEALARRDLTSISRRGRVFYDRHVTARRLPEGRQVLLATNIQPSNPPGAPKEKLLAYVAERLDEMVRGKVVVLLPYSGRNFPHKDKPYHPEEDMDFDDAAEKATKGLKQFDPKKIIPLHTISSDKIERTIIEAEAFYAAGGNAFGHTANTFGFEQFTRESIDVSKSGNKRPLQHLYRQGVANGIPFIGVSAGQQLGGGNIVPSLDTPSMLHIERDKYGEMRVSVRMDGLNLLGNFGLAIQPHYNATNLTNYGDSESQYERIRQLLQKNPWLTILGMANNTALDVRGREMKLVGKPGSKAYILRYNRETRFVESEEIEVGHDLSRFLDTDEHLSVAQRIKKR